MAAENCITFSTAFQWKYFCIVKDKPYRNLTLKKNHSLWKAEGEGFGITASVQPSAVSFIRPVHMSGNAVQLS